MSQPGCATLFLSTLSLRRATGFAGYRRSSQHISIHALLAESDAGFAGYRRSSQHISIHALLAESDEPEFFCIGQPIIFLSTLSLRRATSPNPVCIMVTIIFLSTLSLRRATRSMNINPPSLINFYPRSPCGERPRNTSIAGRITSFLSTLSLRRATRNSQNINRGHKFLSTLSLRRATEVTRNSDTGTYHFYPRSPCGERLWQAAKALDRLCYFYPRSPCGERPAHCFDSGKASGISIHALLAESDLADLHALHGHMHISIHALLAESDSLAHRENPLSRVFLSTLSLRRATGAAPDA